MTCEQQLLKHLQETDGWVKKVHLYAVAEDYSPETVGRALRQLEEEGKIFVDYYDGKMSKNLARYSGKITLKKKQSVTILNGRAVINYE